MDSRRRGCRPIALRFFGGLGYSAEEIRRLKDKKANLKEKLLWE